MFQASDTIRIETGVREGDEVSVHYDPMIAKLVVWGPDRASALLKLRSCLSQYNIDGLATNVDFLMNLAKHPEFQAGNVDTEFITRHYDSLFPKNDVAKTDLCAAAVSLLLAEAGAARLQPSARPADPFSPLSQNVGTRVNHALSRSIKLKSDDKAFTVEVRYQDAAGTAFEVTVTPAKGGAPSTHVVKGSLAAGEAGGLPVVSLDLDGVIHKRQVLVDGARVRVFGGDGGSSLFQRQLPKFVSDHLGGGDRGLGDAVAPMPGVVEKVMVNAGDEVKAGDPLVVMIAMKMEYVIKAPRNGKVDKVNHKVGDFVTKDTLLVQMEQEAEEAEAEA